MEATGQRISPYQLGQFSMEHPDVCYQNSNLSPAVAEEYQAELAARDCLVDDNRNYPGDNQAVFCSEIHADLDTRAPKAVFRVQNEIIGNAVNNLAEHVPGKGQILKCNNNWGGTSG